MYTKEKAIEVIKAICEESKNIDLELSEIGSAGWKKGKELMTPSDWKHIAMVSALSEAFDITPRNLGGE